MAYSNINKDDTQAGVGKSLKTAILTVVLLLVAISAGVNVYNQWTTLRQAVERNKEIESKIKNLEEDNKNMEKQIEYATSSASISRKIREYTGKGTEADYWLILPKVENRGILGAEITEIDEKPVIIQWRDLFTHRR